MRAVGTMTTKGQITVPAEVRDALGLKPGDQVAFVTRDDGVVELHPRKGSVVDLFGMLAPTLRGVTDDDLRDAIERGAMHGEGDATGGRR
jgi:antitoxin PrlF